MYNLKDKEEILKMFHETVEENMSENCSDLALEQFMADSNVSLVRDCIDKIHANVLASVPLGIAVPKVAVYKYLTGSEDGITLAMITITNSISSDKKFSYSFSATVGDTVNKIRGFMEDVYSVLIVDFLINENLELVNSVVSQAVKGAGVSYEVSVVSPVGNEGKKISMIGDKEVVFVADLDRVFDLDDILVLHDVGGLVTEEMVDNAFEQEVNAIATAQTVEQLVSIQGGLLVRYVCDISKLVKPATMIKKVTNRNVTTASKRKDGLFYYKDGDIFALVSKFEGNFEVVLSPFNLKTLRKEDVDVLGAINA